MTGTKVKNFGVRCDARYTIGMCNLYSAGPDSLKGFNFPKDIYPGYPGPVLVGGETRSMVWGFPLAQKSKKTGKPLKPKPVNNARTDKLQSFFWKHSFEERRCLIPVAKWCEAEGQRGAMTRTWMSLPDAEEFHVAGIWRTSDEWGECYSMVMTDSAGPAAQIHNRMPVVLSPGNHEQWLDGSPNDAIALCVAYQGELAIDRTEEPWFKRK